MHRHPRLDRRLAALITIFAATPAGFAQSERYGPVDSTDASVSVLRRSIGGQGNPANLTMFAERGLEGSDAVLHAAVGGPSPEMRVRAVIELARRGEPIQPLISRLETTDQRGAAVVGLLSNDLLDAATAASLVPVLEAPDIASVMAIGVAGLPGDTERLRRIVADEDATSLTRGLAAATLEHRSIEAIDDWKTTIMGSRASERDRVMFELVAILDLLGYRETVLAFLPDVVDRPANDALRAAVVESSLELAPEAGIKAWQALLDACENDMRTPPIGMLLVHSERNAPRDAAVRFPTGDRLSKAVADLVMAAPEDRPAVAVTAIELGHRPTMAWAISNPDARLDRRVLEALLDRSLRTPGTGLGELALQAAEVLAGVDPALIGSRIEAWIDAGGDNDLAVEILFRGLMAAPGPEAVAVAQPHLDAPDRTIRSLALLVLARSGVLDETQRRRLGRAAAGGGGLPPDLRPLAAWLYLDATGDLETSIPRIVEP